MTIDHTRIDKSTVMFALEGRLDTANAPLLERKLKQWGEDITEIILDFKELEYISSMGLRVLLQAKKTMKAENRSLTIKNMQDSVREVFEMTGFLGLMVSEERFIVIRKDEAGSIVLSFNGEMETKNVSAVSDELAKIRDQNSQKSVTVILDMEKFTFISSGAARLLKQAITDTAWDDRNLRIRNVCEDVFLFLKSEEGMEELIER